MSENNLEHCKTIIEFKAGYSLTLDDSFQDFQVGLRHATRRPTIEGGPVWGIVTIGGVKNIININQIVRARPCTTELSPKHQKETKQ